MFKRKTRALLKKGKFERGLLPFSLTLCHYKVNEKVCIRPINESIHNAPDKIYCGKIGIVKAIFNKAYLVQVGNKKIYTSSFHLKKLNQLIH